MLEEARGNPKIYPQTRGMNILISENKTAMGINVSDVGILYTLTARKELIVSTGAVFIVSM